MHLPATPTALLFAYAFLSNIALAVVPHEPAIIWYGPRLGVWTTTLVGTAGTVLAAVAARCLPRYALLAWLGATVRVPAWGMVALFVLLMVPSLRLVWWPRAAS